VGPVSVKEYSTRYTKTAQKSYFVGPNAQKIGDVVDDVFHSQDRLRSAETSHWYAARYIGLAHAADSAKVRNMIAVINFV